MKVFYSLFILFFLCSSCKKENTVTLKDGLEELIAGKLYVMHSMIYADDKPWTTSNIFIIKGVEDTVWIYGSGYGDFGKPCDDTCNDNNYYLGSNFSGTGPATEDVKPIDSIIRNIFHMLRDSVILQFVVPHYHNDHINEEFIDAFYTEFQYPLKAGEKIWIHENDFYGALCDEPCCGTEPCPSKKNKYYGVPYMPKWKPEYKEMFQSIGSENDTCNTIIKTFTSASGMWNITKGLAVSDGGHTDGTINLQNKELHMRICGTKSKQQCPLPEGWESISVHGNVH